jgi:Cu/Ag efflux protein CusF
MNNTRRILLILLALLVAIPVGWVGEIYAQAGPQAPPGTPGAGAPGAPGAGAKEVEGKIKNVDPSGRMVTLEDGTKLTIPPALNVPREALKEGAIVKASFEERGGQNVVTSMRVQPPKQ